MIKMPGECGGIALFITLTCEPSLMYGVFYVTFEPPEVVPCLSAFASVRWLPTNFQKTHCHFLLVLPRLLITMVFLNLGPENSCHSSRNVFNF